jgi:hypothetical protein
MRMLILVVLAGVGLSAVCSAFAQAPANIKPDVEYCGMGECFPQYITSLTKDKSGLILVHMRVEHYCIPGNSCDPTVREPPKTLMSKVQCKTPGGYIETNGQRTSEPERDPPHATQTEEELWTLVCSRARQR